MVTEGPADGSLILAVTLMHAANVKLCPSAGYSFLRDLRPVALVGLTRTHVPYKGGALSMSETIGGQRAGALGFRPSPIGGEGLAPF